jgi:class 3 adenylate cyclase
MPSLPTVTVTFLFTDIEGSTTLLQRLGDRQHADILAEQRRLLREAFAERNGQEIDTR